MSYTVKASDHHEWKEKHLQEFCDFSDRIEYVNQQDDFDGSGKGEWYYIPDDPLPNNDRVIYYGTFAQDHSPGASYYTYAELFDMDDPEDAAAFDVQKKEWENAEEWLPSDDEDEGDEEE